jgi:hypothetical protein
LFDPVAVDNTIHGKAFNNLSSDQLIRIQQVFSEADVPRQAVLVKMKGTPKRNYGAITIKYEKPHKDS